MPGRGPIKNIGADFGQGFKPKKKDYSDFSGKKPKKKDFVGLGKPNTKKIKQRDDKSDFSGANKFKAKSTTKSSPKTFSSFGAAFKDARKRLGAGKTFTYKGKKYTTNLASDKKKASSKTINIKPTPRPKAARNTKPSKMGLNGPKVGVRNGSKPKPKTNGMSTKTPKFFKGTNITPTKAQRERMRKRMMGST